MSLDLEFKTKLEKIQKYIDIVRNYDIVPNEGFYANGGQQKDLIKAYNELDKWCRHDIDDASDSLEDALKNSITQGFEENALTENDVKKIVQRNAQKYVAKDVTASNADSTSSQTTPIKQWVACEEGEPNTIKIPKDSKNCYKPYSDKEDFWGKRLEEGSEKYLITDESNNHIPFTKPEQEFINKKVEELNLSWMTLRTQGIIFDDIPDAKREKALRLLQVFSKVTDKERYKKAIEKLEIPEGKIGELSEDKNLTADDLKAYIPDGFIKSKTAYNSKIEEKVKARKSKEDNYTPAEQMYIKNGGDVDHKDFWKYGANWGGTITKTAAGIGSVYFLSCLIAAAPVIGTCGAAISLPFALAYGRNVYKSWQNTLNQGANRQARGLWTLKKLNFLSKPKGK